MQVSVEARSVPFVEITVTRSTTPTPLSPRLNGHLDVYDSRNTPLTPIPLIFPLLSRDELLIDVVANYVSKLS